MFWVMCKQICRKKNKAWFDHYEHLVSPGQRTSSYCSSHYMHNTETWLGGYVTSFLQLGPRSKWLPAMWTPKQVSQKSEYPPLEIFFKNSKVLVCLERSLSSTKIEHICTICILKIVTYALSQIVGCSIFCSISRWARETVMLACLVLIKVSWTRHTIIGCSVKHVSSGTIFCRK